MATVTLTALATSAAEDLGVIDSGGALSAAQIAQALTAVNNMLDNWSSQKLMIARALVQTFALTNGTQSYAIGPAQTFAVTPAPVKLAAAQLLNTTGASSPITVLNALEWSRLSDRQSNSFLVKHCFYDRASTGKVYFSPIPQVVSANLSVELTMWVAMAQFVDASTPYTLIPGYQRLMETGLALELAPKYDVAPTAQLAANYQSALANVVALNADLFGPDQQESQTAAVAPPEPVATP